MTSTAYELCLSGYFYEETKNPALFKYTVLSHRGFHGQKAHLQADSQSKGDRQKHNSRGGGHTEAPPALGGVSYTGRRPTREGHLARRGHRRRSGSPQGHSRTPARGARPTRRQQAGGAQKEAQWLAQTRLGTGPHQWQVGLGKGIHPPGATPRPRPRKEGRNQPRDRREVAASSPSTLVGLSFPLRRGRPCER